MNRFFSQLKKPLLPCGGFSLKPKTMICNGINFNDQWLSKFESAEEFVNHEKVQYFIEKGIVSKDDLSSFFEIYQSQKTVESHGNLNQDVQGEIQEAQPQSSDCGNGEGEEGSDSRPAGNTDEQGRKSRRNKVS